MDLFSFDSNKDYFTKQFAPFGFPHVSQMVSSQTFFHLKKYFSICIFGVQCLLKFFMFLIIYFLFFNYICLIIFKLFIYYLFTFSLLLSWSLMLPCFLQGSNLYTRLYMFWPLFQGVLPMLLPCPAGQELHK